VDYAQIHLNFRSGAVAHLEASWAVPANFPFSTSLELCGTAGMLQMDNSEQSTSIEVYAPGAPISKSAPMEFNGYFHEIDAFIKAVEEKRERAPVDVSDVVHPLEVALAAKQSIRTGKLVRLSSCSAPSAPSAGSADGPSASFAGSADGPSAPGASSA
jgi:predicted dehydrogenase